MSADTLVLGGRVVKVLTQEVYDGGVAIAGERIAAVGDVEYARGPDTRVIDAEGRYVTGLVDGHLHMYHSYLGVNAYVETLLRHGVTSTADGFYGQGVVGGIDAIDDRRDNITRRERRAPASSMHAKDGRSSDECRFKG